MCYLLTFQSTATCPTRTELGNSSHTISSADSPCTITSATLNVIQGIGETITVQDGAVFNINATSNSFVINGDITIDSGAVLNINAQFINISSTGSLSIDSGATVNVTDADNFTVSGGDVNVGGNMLLTSLNFVVRDNGTMTVDAGALVDLDSLVSGGGSFRIGNGSGSTIGTLIMNGRLEVEGDLFIHGQGDLDGSGTLDVDGDITENAGGDSSDWTGTTECGGSNCDPLPVELTIWKASKEGVNSVRLLWQTNTEVDNLGFEIQKRTLVTGFEVLAFIDGHGTSTKVHQYNFVDEEHLEDAYYRLVQIDFDGQRNVYQELFVGSSVRNKIKISPNPVTSQLKLVGPNTLLLSANLMNTTGQLIKHFDFTPISEVQKGLNEQLVFLENGVYIIQLSSPENIQYLKFKKE